MPHPPLPTIDEGVLDHPEDLYLPQRSASAQPGGCASIDDKAVEGYHQLGYLAVAEVLDPRQVRDALDALDDLLDGKNPEFNGLMYEAAAREGVPVDRLDHNAQLDLVRKLHNFCRFDDRLDQIAHAPALLDAVRRLMGGRSPELFQDMAMLKPPRVGREKPWHQDHAYFDVAVQDRLVGVWIALDRADLDNGCMQVLEARHADGPIVHFKRRDWQICDADLAGQHSVAVPLAPGGALFFDSLLPHGTPSNRSPRRRRALQFHYAPEGCSQVPTEERLAVFGSEGKDVTC